MSLKTRRFIMVDLKKNVLLSPPLEFFSSSSIFWIALKISGFLRNAYRSRCLAQLLSCRMDNGSLPRRWGAAKADGRLLSGVGKWKLCEDEHCSILCYSRLCSTPSSASLPPCISCNTSRSSLDQESRTIPSN